MLRGTNEHLQDPGNDVVAMKPIHLIAAAQPPVRRLRWLVLAAAFSCCLATGKVDAAEAASTVSPSATAAAVECVILLHGLGRTYRSMGPMRDALEQAGYATANIDYPSRDHPIEKLAPETIGIGLERCEGQAANRIHFVTHSMGGILVRYYLAHERLAKLGRVVMLSPPNQGSEVVDHLHDKTIFSWYNGPAGQQLGTGDDSLPLRLGPVDFPLGVITGNKVAFFDEWLDDMFPGPNDGKVSVERAKVEGMHDFLVMPYTHPYIMKAEPVITQTIHFLRHGRFTR